MRQCFAAGSTCVGLLVWHPWCCRIEGGPTLIYLEKLLIDSIVGEPSHRRKLRPNVARHPSASPYGRALWTPGVSRPTYPPHLGVFGFPMAESKASSHLDKPLTRGNKEAWRVTIRAPRTMQQMRGALMRQQQSGSRMRLTPCAAACRSA